MKDLRTQGEHSRKRSEKSPFAKLKLEASERANVGAWNKRCRLSFAVNFVWLITKAFLKRRIILCTAPPRFWWSFQLRSKNSTIGKQENLFASPPDERLFQDQLIGKFADPFSANLHFSCATFPSFARIDVVQKNAQLFWVSLLPPIGVYCRISASPPEPGTP